MEQVEAELAQVEAELAQASDQTYQRGRRAPQNFYRPSTALYLLPPGWDMDSIQSPVAFYKAQLVKDPDDV